MNFLLSVSPRKVNVQPWQFCNKSLLVYINMRTLRMAQRSLVKISFFNIPDCFSQNQVNYYDVKDARKRNSK